MSPSSLWSHIATLLNPRGVLGGGWLVDRVLNGDVKVLWEHLVTEPGDVGSCLNSPIGSKEPDEKAQ